MNPKCKPDSSNEVLHTAVISLAVTTGLLFVVLILICAMEVYCVYYKPRSIRMTQSVAYGIHQEIPSASRNS